MTVTTAPRIVTDVVNHEISPNWGREVLVLEEGSSTVIGTVLARILLAGATSAAKSGGNTGNGTLVLDATTPLLAGAKTGIYSVRFTSATAYTVEDPDGNVIGSGSNTVAFSDDLKFVTTAGGTPFIAGDGFDITVTAAATEKVLPLDPAGLRGEQTAFAVAIQERPVAEADQPVLAIVRGAVVDLDGLVWPAGITTVQKNAALHTLRERGIVARESI
jgi:hypothetical protein